MIEVYLDCPSPTASGPIVSECGTSKNVLWPTPGLQTTYFFVQNINRQLIGLTFSGITNAGSNVDVDIVYTRDGVTITAATLNLGVITSDTTKYHFLDFGTNVPPTGIFYLKFNISGGSSGDIDVFLDCNVPVGSRDFCFADFKSAPRNLCTTCPSVVKIYFPRNTSGFGSQLNLFSYSTWYTDPNLSTIAPNGYYTPVNSSLPKTIYSWTGAPPATIAHLCDPREVPCGSALTQSHAVSTDYTNSSPYIPGVTDVTLSGLKYSTKEYFITFPSTQLGYLELIVSNTQTYQKEVVFTVSDANAPRGTTGVISYSETPINSSEFFRFVTPQTLIKVPKNSSKTITLVLNAQTNSPTTTLRIRVSVGLPKRYKNNSSPNIQTTVSASCLNTIYSGNTGLHAYSAWDAANSPKCTTTLFSFTNPASWGVDTRVWHDPSLANPALPYFYSYGSNVFKVGQPFKREFGIKINYELKTKLIRTLGSMLGLSQKNPVTVTPKILGPKDWQTPTQVPACIEPTMKDIGLVKYVYNVGSLPEPTKYLYLVGKDPSSKIVANDSVFTQFDFNTSSHKPITGLIHSLSKIASGSYLRASNDPQIRLLIGSPGAAFAAAGLGLLATIITLSPSTFGLSITGAGLSGGLGGVVGATLNGTPYCLIGLSVGGMLVVATLIALALFLLFKNKKKVVEEPCKLFDKVYTNNEYLELSNTIYSNSAMTVNGITGYYTDGGYFYTTTNGLISGKEVSYTNMNGARTYSLTPDNPTYITGIQAFFLLPYVSGRPYEWTTGVYLNSPISTSAVSTAKVGELNTPATIDYEIPEGFFEASTQVEADNLAQEYLSGLTAQTISTLLSAEQLPTASGTTTVFSHEIKLENIEAVWAIFFDNADNLGLTIGKTLYYDNNGLFSVLDGYYSISGDSGNFRTFYKTSGGTIIDYYDMTTSGATIVTSPTSGTLPVETTGQTYTSSWYFQGPVLENVMYDDTNNINGFNETWNTSAFYSNEYVKRGMIDTPVSKSSLLTYVNNTTSYAFEVAPEGWYREIPNIFNENPFLIQSATTIYLDTIQNCSEDAYNGIYVTCVDESGNTMPSFYGVKGVLSVSTSSGVTTHDYVIENDDYRGFVPLGLEYINAITAATVTVTSTNPISGITFTDGTFYPCVVATPTPTPVVSPDVTSTPTITPTNTPTPTCPYVSCYHYVEFTISGETSIEWVLCNSSTVTFGYSSLTYPATFVEGPFTEADCFSGNSYTVVSGSTPYSVNYYNACCEELVTPTPTATTEPVTPTPTQTSTQTPTATTEPVTPTPTPTCPFVDCYHYVEFTISAETSIEWVLCNASTVTFGYSSVTYPATFVEGPFTEADCFSGNSYSVVSGSTPYSVNYYNACCEELVTPTPTATNEPPTPTPTFTPTSTETPTPTNTETQTPTPTETLTSTPTETQTQTPTETPTQTSTQTQTPTQTSTTTLTATPTPTTVCFCFSLTNDGDPTNTNTTTWTDCDGNPQSIVNKIFNSAADYFCAIDGTVSYSAGLTVVRQYPCTGSCP